MIGLTQKREQKGSQRKTLDERENSRSMSPLPNFTRREYELVKGYAFYKEITVNKTDCMQKQRE